MIMESVTFQTMKFEESIRFYEKNVGLKILRDLRGRGPHNIVFMGDPRGGTCIELIEDASEGFEGEHISLGFHTDDVVKKREEAEAGGLHPTPMISPEPAVQFFFVKDPNGMDIQFIQIEG